MPERLNGSDDDAPDVLTSVRTADRSATGAAANGAANEPVNPTAVTGEMPIVQRPVGADDTTADALPAFSAADFETPEGNGFADSEQTGPIAFAVAQALLNNAATDATNSPRVPTLEEVAALLAPARAHTTQELNNTIENLGGSYTANVAATLLSMSEADLRSSGLIILPDDQVPAFQIRKGIPLAGIVEVANAFRAVNPKDTESVMLLQFCADRLRELGGRSPVEVLKGAHELAATTGGDTSATINKVADLARKYPQAGMYALEV